MPLPEEMEVISDQETLNELMSRCDVSYDGVSAAGAINFNPSFGKICTGEHFKVLFTIQNSNPLYSLEELKLKSTVARMTKNE